MVITISLNSCLTRSQGNFSSIRTMVDMIKTQTTAENRFMNRILPHYYKYVTENHTTLVRVYGMHRG